MSETANNGPAKTPPGTLGERVQSLRLSESSEATGSGLWWLPWVFCALLGCAAGVLALEAFSPIDDELLKKLAAERGLNIGKDAQAATIVSLPGADGQSLTTSDIALESKGYIVPIRLIQVSPKVSGTVMKLNIEEGKFVKKGFPLAELEKVEYESDYDHTKGVVRAAQRSEERRVGKECRL